MDGRRQGAAGGQDEWKRVVLIALIASLIGLGAQQNVAEGFAKQYISLRQMPTQVELDSYLEDMVNQFLDNSQSKVKQPSESKPPDILIFDCGDDGILRAIINEVPSDGNCFLHCMIAFRKDRFNKGKECPEFPLDSTELRREVVDFMRSNLDHPTMCSRISLRKYFNQNYGPSVPPSSRLQVRRSGESSPERACFYVNDVMHFLDIMSQPGTHVVEAFIAAFAELYQLRVQVITQARSEAIPVEFMDDPNVEALMAFGVSLKDAKTLLIKYQGNVDKAMDEVLRQRDPEPVVDSSTIRWQIQPYGKSTKTIVGLRLSGGHYDLMMPPLIFHQPEANSCLPPRIIPQEDSTGGAAAVSAKPAQSSRILSAGGGTPTVPHRSPPSFGHSQQDRRRFDAPFVIEAKYLPDSVFSTLDGFLRAIAGIVGNSGAYPQYVEVTGLSIPFASADSIQLWGSFPVPNGGENYHPYRGMIFMFDDGSVKQYDGSVDDLSDPENKATFSERVLQFWRDRNRVLSGIRFERCQLKPIPKKK
jgi:hypothetical protein